MPPSTNLPRKRRWPKIVGIVVLGLVVLFGALYFFVVSATAAPLKVSDSFISDIKANDATSAYTLTSSVFQAATTEAALQDIATAESQILTGKFAVTSRSISSSTSTGTVAVILYKTTGSDGAVYYVKSELVKTDGKWYVGSYRVEKTPLSSAVE